MKNNIELAKEELAEIRVFNPDAIEEIAERYFLKLKATYAIWKKVQGR